MNIDILSNSVVRNIENISTNRKMTELRTKVYVAFSIFYLLLKF